MQTLTRLALALLLCQVLSAQEKPAEKPKDDFTPSFKIGALLFADYTYTQEPTALDADGNRFHPNTFNVSRAYVNIYGTLTRRVSFRITPESARETGSGTSVSGSQVYRLKFGYVQFALDDWLSKGSFVRAGLIETPFVGYEESIYRYRFQGTIMVDREGLVIPADYGVTFLYNLPGDYGTVHAGVFNGEGFARSEVNDQKAIGIRATVRPFPHHAIARGLRLTAYYHRDRYAENAPRNRAIGQITFEHPRLHAGLDLEASTDRRTAALPETDHRGYSIWATPRFGHGWEALLRYDRVKPDQHTGDTRQRDIEGIAYWFPMPDKSPVIAAILLDRDHLRGIGGPATSYGVKMLVSF
jgi:hypothetical protein